MRGWEWRYLWQQCQSDALYTLCRKSNTVFSLAISPDGKWAAVGEENDGQVSIWDLEKREEVKRLSAGEGPAFVSFSPSGRLLAFSSGIGRLSSNAQHRIRLWDGDSGRLGAELPLEGACRGLAFSSDGQTLASLSATRGSPEAQLTLWNVPEGRKLARYPAGPVRTITGNRFAVAPDLSVAAYAVGTDRIRVVDLRTGQELWSAKPPDDYVTALALSPDGKILASGGGFAPSAIRLWNVASGRQTGESSVSESHGGWVGSLVFWPDGKTLASGSTDQTIRLWSTEGLRPLRILLGHKGEVWSLALGPDDKTLLSGCKDGSVLVWDTTSSERASSYVRLPESLLAWSFATNGQTILTCDRRGRVAQWQGNPFAEERLFEIGTNVSRVTFIPGRSIVLARLTDGRVQVWDLQARRFARELTALPFGPLPRWLCMAQGNTLIIGDLTNDSLQQWDLATWQKVRTWRAPARLWTGALSPDARWCVTLGYDGASMIDDLATARTTVGNLQISGSQDATFSADGKLLAAPSDLGFARIWDANTLQEIATLRGFLQGVHSVAFSPDGQRVVTGGSGREAIKLWDVESHQELLTLEGQASVFVPVAFSPDGNLIGSMNRPDIQRSILHLWRAPSWAEIEAAEQAETLRTR